MKSEIIFRKETGSRGRYGNVSGSYTTIGAFFDNPGEWPYQVKLEFTKRDDDYRMVVTDTELYKLSKNDYLTIKKAIENSKRELSSCQEHIRNETMDGSSELFKFCADGFSKTIYGSSILSIGYYEADTRKPSDRTDNYTVYSIVSEIKKLLEAANIYVL